MEKKSLSRSRRAGVLLHPTSLPGALSNGDIGHQAYRFIEFLHAHDFKVWQMLPLGPTLDDKSPYQSLSAHAGNQLLISLDWLEDRGWLDKKNIHQCETQEHYRHECLQFAANTFYREVGCNRCDVCSDQSWFDKLDEFKKENAYWLDDYALFCALKVQYLGKAWYEWPLELRHREEKALKQAKNSLNKEINQVIFEQFIFFTQWHEIREYAQQHDIELFGDMPIFMGIDCADVWAKNENFLIDQDGHQDYVAGVPPDAFSETGQRWGNPLYDWLSMENNQFSWWKDRFKTQLKLFDIIRLDHFRGLEACWYINADSETAIDGFWQKVPGDKLLSALFDSYGELPIIAEDLGVITDEVIALKESFNLPGMRVLQFAFDGNTDNPHLPHAYESNDVVYTGTHDNDTSLGWLLDRQFNIPFINDYMGHSIVPMDENEENKIPNEEQLLDIVRIAMSSVSFLSMIPMQDLLILDTNSRMNTPGTVGNNWHWRFNWQQLNPDYLSKISHLMSLYNR